jgi:predicted glutamine amidotransferase
MCGIVYVWRKDATPAAKKVLKRYHKQRGRGTDGFGYVAVGDTHIVEEYERYMTEQDASKALLESQSKHILFHHRYPTSTVNVPETAHPIFVRNGELKHSYYVVHNGVINNARELKKKHTELGYSYNTEVTTQYQTAKKRTYYGATEFNDSESLAIELGRTIEGLQPEVTATGSIACIVFQANKAGTRIEAVYYGTNGSNPLTITEDDYSLCIASEGGTPIQARTMYRLDVTTRERSTVNVPFKLTPAKVPYPYQTNTYHYQNGDEYGYDDDEPEEDDYTPAEPDAWEIEDLYTELADVEADMSIAEQAHELEEFEELAIEREGILWQIKELEEFERAKTIGF